LGVLVVDGVTFLRARPTLPVRDVDKALDLYERVLGFEVRVRYGEPPTYATVGAGDAFISLSLDRDGSTAGPGQLLHHGHRRRGALRAL